MAILFSENTSLASQRNDARLAASGLKGENYPLILSSVGTIMISQSEYHMAYGFMPGETVNGFVFNSTVTGAGCTYFRFGIHNGAGTLVASTADGSTQANGTAGTLAVAITTPYVIPTAPGPYVVSLLCVTATTMPTLSRAPASASVLSGNALAGANFGQYGVTASLAALAPTATFNFGAANSIPFWFGHY